MTRYIVGPPPMASSVARLDTATNVPRRRSRSSAPLTRPPSSQQELEGPVLLEGADGRPPPHLLGEAIHDLDAGEIALVDRAVVALAGEGLLVDCARLGWRSKKQP